MRSLAGSLAEGVLADAFFKSTNIYLYVHIIISTPTPITLPPLALRVRGNESWMFAYLALFVQMDDTITRTNATVFSKLELAFGSKSSTAAAACRPDNKQNRCSSDLEEVRH